jgi:hypothetical protein
MDHRSGATLQKGPTPGGWTHLVRPEWVRVLGTRGRVAVAGTIDGEAFRTSLTALGGGTNGLAVAATVRRVIGEQAGDEVEVHLLERTGPARPAS